MVALDEQLHRHGLLPRLLGTGDRLQAGKSVQSEKGVDSGRAGMDRSPGAPRGSLGSSYEYHLPDVDMKVS